MLSVIAKYLNAKLATLRYLDKNLGLAAIIQHGETTFPAYHDKGEYQSINYDAYRTLTYILPNGNISRTSEEHPYLGCKYLVKETVPFKIIVYVQGKENWNCESKSQDIVWGISQILTGRQKVLESAAGYEDVDIQIKNHNLIKRTVWSELYNVDSRLKDNDILLSIELEVLTEGVESCFVADPCEGRDFTFSLSQLAFCERVDTCLASKSDTLTVDILAGTHNYAHTIGAIPDLINFWKDNRLWNMPFDAEATANDLIITSTDDYNSITIKLLKF